MDNTQLLDSLLSLVFDPNLESMLRDALNRRAGVVSADLKSLAAREAHSRVAAPTVEKAVAAAVVARVWPTKDEVKAAPRRQDLVRMIADFGMPIDTGLQQSPSQLRKDIIAFIETAKAAEPQIGEVLVDDRQLELPVEAVAEPVTAEPTPEPVPEPVEVAPPCAAGVPEPQEVEPVVEPTRSTEAEAFAVASDVVEAQPKAEEAKVEAPKPAPVEVAPEVVIPPPAPAPTVLTPVERREDMISWVKKFLGSAADGKVLTKEGQPAEQKWLLAGASTPVQDYVAATLGDFMAQPQTRNELAVQKFWQVLGCAGNCRTCPHGTAQTVLCYGYYESEALGRNGKQFLSAEEVVKTGECWIIEGKATAPCYAKTFKKEYTK